MESAAGLGTALRAAQDALDRGDYLTSVDYWRHATALARASRSFTPCDLAAFLNSLGMACKFSGKYEEGEAAYHEALALLEPILDRGHLWFATLYHNLGGLEHARGRCAAGEVWARKGLAIRKQALGPDHVEVAVDLAALAALLDGQGKFEESEPLHTRTLAIFERELGPEHLEIGMTLANLAALFPLYAAFSGEICRVADVHEVLVRVQVGEEALSDIRLGQNVRVKTRTFPDRVFRGIVSKVGGESEVNENGQRTYRLEFTIQNGEGWLKPGMTVFTRADFGRRPVIWLLGHKLKQALRPEMWML